MNSMPEKTITLNIGDYPGGIAIWGALPAIFDSSQQGFDRGVHVHARLANTAKKAIDETYQTVRILCGKKSYEINEEIAVHFSMASIFNHKIISLTCRECGHDLLSSELFSLIPHHEHLCHYCGHINLTDQACVINPIMALKAALGDHIIQRQSILPTRSIRIDTDKYLGGVQIWGSNPSIIWTAKRLEESAIHVHAYSNHERRVIDNTYGEVYLNGEYLDIHMIRVLQIQQSIPELIAKVSVVTCPFCGVMQFDQGIRAVIPQTARRCQQCNKAFTHEPKISNPVIQVLNQFKGKLYDSQYNH